MPSSVSTVLLVFGAVLLAVSVTTGVIVAGIGVAFELVMFYFQGTAPR